MPERIQMSRRHPWRPEHPDAVIVARPHDWANPFVIGGEAVVEVKSIYEPDAHYAHVADVDRQFAVDLFRWWVTTRPALMAQIREELAGKDLACWCPLDQACHADVLLAIAAGETP